MIRIWLLAAGLVLGAAFPAAAHDEKKAASESHDDALVKLTERQVEAGKFAVTEVAGGDLSKRISVPGSIVPSGDRIARVAVRLLGTVAELRKRLGDPVEAGEVVAVIESREVADAKSEYLATRVTDELQQTLFDALDTAVGRQGRHRERLPARPRQRSRMRGSSSIRRGRSCSRSA